MQFVFFLLYAALGIVQIMAYLAGIELWLGLGTFWGLVIFFITAALPFGSVIDAAIAFYGAYKGWHWLWWQAALLTFPFAIIGIAIASAGGMVAMMHTLFHRRSTP